GGEAIAAEGFERIHRTTVIGMGVMHLQFEEGTTRNPLQLDRTEPYAVQGTAAPGAKLGLVIHRKTAGVDRGPMTCRRATAEEVTVYAAGGVLQRFAQNFLASEGAA